jgi:hypothetical protein
MIRHIHTRLRRARILTPPQTRNRLQLRIKPQPRLSIKVIRSTTSDTFLVSGEGEDWERDLNSLAISITKIEI